MVPPRFMLSVSFRVCLSVLWLFLPFAFTPFSLYPTVCLSSKTHDVWLTAAPPSQTRLASSMAQRLITGNWLTHTRTDAHTLQLHKHEINNSICAGENRQNRRQRTTSKSICVLVVQVSSNSPSAKDCKTHHLGVDNSPSGFDGRVANKNWIFRLKYTKSMWLFPFLSLLQLLLRTSNS